MVPFDLRIVLPFAAAIVLGIGAIGCDNHHHHADRVGNDLEDAAEEAGDTIEDTADDVGDAVEDAVD